MWMQDDVWNWVNDNPDVKAHVLKKCSREGCEVLETRVAQFKRCAACHKAWYCGTACQKKDWETHKIGSWCFHTLPPYRCFLFPPELDHVWSPTGSNLLRHHPFFFFSHSVLAADPIRPYASQNAVATPRASRCSNASCEPAKRTTPPGPPYSDEFEPR